MTPARLALAAAVALAAVPPAPACTFCTGEVRSRLTLRLHHAQAQLVVSGALKNPRFDPATDRGTTDLHVKEVLKADPAAAGKGVLTLPKYLPVIGDTPPDYLMFCGVRDGRIDPTYGLPVTPALADYAKGAAALPDADPPAKLGFFFKHIDSADPAVAADAFLEFARASDTDILKAAGKFDPAPLRKLIADPKTPAERLGVFAFLLGACGGKPEATFLLGLLTARPMPEGISSAVGGLLAGYILLAPGDGWKLTADTLADPDRPYSQRLSAIGTVRFFQATRPAESKAEVLKCCAALLPHGDLADQAVEDLRRWGWWDLTAGVLAQYAKPTHAAPIVRRGIVRYALTCPNDDAKRFVAAVRAADPKLVEAVEESLALFDPVKPK